MIVIMKYCGKCHEHTPRGHRGSCKPCKNARARVRRSTPEGKAAACKSSTDWRLKHLDRANATQTARRSTPQGVAVVLLQRARRRAKSAGLPFSLSLDSLRQKLERGVCEVSGLPFVLTPFGNPRRPSIDQIRAGEGYTPQNTRVVLWGINVACHTWGLEAITEIFRSVP